jgi:PPOX class probable F420-dependent enzyme
MQLTDEMRLFLAECRFGVLATIGDDGVPQQTVMWYELEENRVLMNTLRGRVKDRHLRRDARASLCVEDGYRYLTITGTVTLNDDAATAQADIARLARRYHGPNAERHIAQFLGQERVTLYLALGHVVANGFGQ